MSEERIQELMVDYLDGNLDEAQLKEFEELKAKGLIKTEELENLKNTLFAFNALHDPEPGLSLEYKFQCMLSAKIEAAEMAKPQLSWAGLWAGLGDFLSPAKLAYSLIIFGFGFLSAWLFMSPKQEQKDIELLAHELSQVRQMLFTTLIEQPTAVDRLKAVNISQEMTNADEIVIESLFNSLNADPNVNVRLAAIEALKKHVAKPEVREKLILSINKQDSPMVQIALANLMKDLQEKNALPQLRKLLEDEKTNEFVKDKVKESINVLI